MKRTAAALMMLVSSVLSMQTWGRASGFPEDPGTVVVTKRAVTIFVGFDTRTPAGLIPFVRCDLYEPKLFGKWPVVQIQPGTATNREYMTGWGFRLATHGAIVFVCERRTSVDQLAADALTHGGVGRTYAGDTVGDFTQRLTAEDQLRVLRWAIRQGHIQSSPLFARVYETRLGLLGYSSGGQTTALATAMSRTEGPHLAATGLLDPGDLVPPTPLDDDSSAHAASSFDTPTVLVTSDGDPPVFCDQSRGRSCVLTGDEVWAALPAGLAKFGLRIVGMQHGDVAPDPPTCTYSTLLDPAAYRLDRIIGKTTGMAGTLCGDVPPDIAEHTRLMKRFSLAFLELFLECDPNALDYVNGSATQTEVANGKILVLAGSSTFPGLPSSCGSGPSITFRRS